MENFQVGCVGGGILILLIFMNVPVAFCMAAVGTAGLIYLYDFHAVLKFVPVQIYSSTATFSLAALPLFMLMGNLAVYADLSKDCYDSARAWLGRIPGGLAIATVYACAIFGAASGSGLAEAAVFSKIAVPEMLRAGYNKRMAVGVVAAASGVDALIPPSILMVIFGVLTQTSIGQLLVAGILPGILYAVIFAAAIMLWCYLLPSYAPKSGDCDTSWKARITSLRGVWGILALFALVLGSIYVGWATPDEAAGVGVVGSFLLVLIRKRYSWLNLKAAAIESAKASAMIFLLVGSATIFTTFISVTGVITTWTNWIAGMQLPYWGILMVIVVLYLILGCFLDPTSIMVLTLPVVVPIIVSYGASLIWFGVIITMLSVIGGITPPFGLLLFVTKAALGNQVELTDVMIGAFPFIILMLIIVSILCIFPQISLYLPSLMGSV
jgi:C4-dicarboxylate transporter, DctM subunit